MSATDAYTGKDIDIPRLKESLDIVDIIGQYVQLIKDGRRYKGLCPFHSEKTPSFTVFPDGNSRRAPGFKCFGCGERGDVIDFIQKQEGLTLREIAKRYDSIGRFVRDASKPYTPPPPPPPRPKPQVSAEMIALYTRTWELSREILLNGVSREVEEARLYLETRGFLKKDLPSVDLGAYLPEIRETIGSEFPEKLARKGGLFSHGMAYNYQVVTPHYNREGQIVGLTFRLAKEGIDPDGNPLRKYKHTPELDKSFPYNLYKALPEIRKQKGNVIIVEGHLDVQTLILAGYKNVICLGGASLNDEHIKLLVALGVRSVTLWLDNDDPGQFGCSKAAALVLASTLGLRVVECRKFKDPGEINNMIGDRGRLISEFVNNATSGGEWLGCYIGTVENAAEKDEALVTAKDAYLKIINPFAKEDFMKYLSKKIGYRVDFLKTQFEGSVKPATPVKSSTAKPEARKGRSADGSTFYEQLAAVYHKHKDLQSLQNFLERYYRQYAKALSGDTRDDLKQMIIYCRGVRINELTDHLESTLKERSLWQ